MGPGKQRARANEVGKALDQPRAGITGQSVGQGADRRRAHQAIGIENKHRVMRAAPMGHPVGKVADLAVRILRASPIEHLNIGRQACAQMRKRDFFPHGHVRITRVR